MTIATAFDARSANCTSSKIMNGITTGKVERNTSRKIATAFIQSSRSSVGRAGSEGRAMMPRRRLSTSSGDMIDATTGGSASAMIRRA
jgi:hypothetical protein